MLEELFKLKVKQKSFISSQEIDGFYEDFIFIKNDDGSYIATGNVIVAQKYPDDKEYTCKKYEWVFTLKRPEGDWYKISDIKKTEIGELTEKDNWVYEYLYPED